MARATQRIERADEIEHGAVDHGALGRRLGIELGQVMLVAEILHDGAAFPEHALGQALGLHHRREVGRVHGQELLGAGLAVNVILGEFELGGAHEDADGHVVHTWFQHMQFHISSSLGSFSTDSLATGLPTVTRFFGSSALQWHRQDEPRRCCSLRARRGFYGLRTAHPHG